MGIDYPVLKDFLPDGTGEIGSDEFELFNADENIEFDPAGGNGSIMKDQQAKLKKPKSKLRLRYHRS